MKNKNKMFEIQLLSEENIQQAESKIISHLRPIEDNSLICISSCFVEDAKKCYQQMQDAVEGSYCLFSENSLGYVCYGFYKSFTGQIFILNSSLNKIIDVYRPPKNIYWLENDT